jgi:hypothetical protein
MFTLTQVPALNPSQSSYLTTKDFSQVKQSQTLCMTHIPGNTQELVANIGHGIL